MTQQRLTGVATIALAVGFNLPYAALAMAYDYPAVLRRPAGEALEMFQAGGPALILIWQAFMLAALALVPLAAALAITRARMVAQPTLAVGAAVTGALAGLAQAIGLSRWVFAVPDLARHQADPLTRRASESAFELLNSWGGVAIGEHLGQLLLVMFVSQIAMLQRSEDLKFHSALGGLTAALIFVGSGEGVALAVGFSGDVFSVATIAGFLMLTLWLITTGAGLIRTARQGSTRESFAETPDRASDPWARLWPWR